MTVHQADSWSQVGNVQGTAVGMSDGRGDPGRHDSHMSHAFVVPFK